MGKINYHNIRSVDDILSPDDISSILNSWDLHAEMSDDPKKYSRMQAVKSMVSMYVKSNGIKFSSLELNSRGKEALNSYFIMESIRKIIKQELKNRKFTFRGVRSIILFILFPAFLQAQIQDTTCFTNSQVIKISQNIDSLERVTVVQGDIIKSQNKQIDRLEVLNAQNESLMLVQADELKVTKQALDHTISINNSIVTDEKWYESKYMYFIYGAATIYAGALIVNLIR